MLRDGAAARALRVGELRTVPVGHVADAAEIAQRLVECAQNAGTAACKRAVGALQHPVSRMTGYVQRRLQHQLEPQPSAQPREDRPQARLLVAERAGGRAMGDRCCHSRNS